MYDIWLYIVNMYMSLDLALTCFNPPVVDLATSYGNFQHAGGMSCIRSFQDQLKSHWCQSNR